MIKFKAKLLAVGVLGASLLAGCGGDSHDRDARVVQPPQEQTITAVADFIKNLIASNGENTDPIDINPLTLAADDTSEPASVD
ncbi:MAG: hypothetical protein ABIQ90_15425 [Polaromonas sp.]